jgi:hypothetical protein
MFRAYPKLTLQRNQISWNRCGSIAEALRARRGRIAEAVQLVQVPRQTLQLLGRDIASLRDSSPGLLLHDLHQMQYWTRRKPHRCCRLLLSRLRWLLQPAESFLHPTISSKWGLGI